MTEIPFFIWRRAYASCVRGAFNRFEEIVEADDRVEMYFAVADRFEMFFRAVDLRAFDAAELERVVMSLRFRDEEDVLLAVAGKGDRPIGAVASHGGGDVEALGEFCVDGDLCGVFETAGELLLDLRVAEDVVVDVALRFDRVSVFAGVAAQRRVGEDVQRVTLVRRPVLDMLDDNRRLLGNWLIVRIRNPPQFASPLSVALAPPRRCSEPEERPVYISSRYRS